MLFCIMIIVKNQVGVCFNIERLFTPRFPLNQWKAVSEEEREREREIIVCYIIIEVVRKNGKSVNKEKQYKMPMKKQ